MEIIENTVKVMDASRITIVRSARNNKMLIVDDYLYYFEDRGQNTFRWVCAKRKSENCRARLVTTAVVGDDTKHVVVRISGAHSHDRCVKSEIDKTFRRSQTAEDEEKTQITRIPLKKSYEHLVEDIISDNDEPDDEIHESDNEVDYIEEEEENIRDNIQVVKKSTYKKKEEKKQDPIFKTLSKFQHNKVYVLRTQHNRELVCVNGFLYRLEGKSKTSATFRWECIRSDANCKTRIYTERFDDGRHNLKQLAGNQVLHDHERYTPIKLWKLVEKHNITVMQSDVIPDKQNYTELIPHYAISSGVDPLASRRKKTVRPKPVRENKKIMLLPSAKGKKMLCVDKMIYQYDTRSPSKRRVYWTCYYRHSKQYKCNARLVTEETIDGLRITKSSGSHKHPDHSAEIKHQVKMMAKEKKTLKRRALAKKQSRKSSWKSNTLMTLGFSDSDSSSSGESSISSDEPDLPERLEDMRQHFAIKVEKRLHPETPEHIDFVDSIDTDFFESEYTNEASNAPKSEKSHSTPNPIKKRGRKRKLPTESSSMEYEMDITKVSQLRSAKGGVLLCVDGYIYHMKSEASRRNYWICIKNRDYSIKCKSFVTTCRDSEEIKIIHVTNKHNHPVNENDIKRRLCNELTASGALPKTTFKAGYYLNRTLDEVKAECAAILNKTELKLDVTRSEGSKMKLYSISNGPPSLAVRMTLKALNIPFELVPIDYLTGEHTTESFAEMNPQKEVPVLDDDGYYLSESIAIMQYLCDKYAPDNKIYSKDPTARSLVNHRLCFNMGFYYASICAHVILPYFFDSPKNEMTLKKVNNALSVFETYLQRTGTKYAAANHVTIADFALVSATLCLEGTAFDLSPYPLVKKWYETFKRENPTIWEIGNGGMQEITDLSKNPPDLLHVKSGA